MSYVDSLISRFLSHYGNESALVRSKASSLFVLYCILIAAGFIFIGLSFLFLKIGSDVVLVTVSLLLLTLGLVFLRYGFYSFSIGTLLLALIGIMSLTVILSTNHEPIKLYNLAIYGILALLISGLIGMHPWLALVVGSINLVNQTVYLVFFVMPANLKPANLMYDSYIASMVLIGLSALISLFLNKQLNGYILRLTEMNEGLEYTIAERTRELVKSRDKLVENEKLKALGGVVAGMAHEINTPLGVSITASSFISGLLENLDPQNESVLSMQVSVGLIERNLDKVKSHVQRFRQLSAEEFGLDPVEVSVSDLIRTVLIDFELKQENLPGVSVVVNISESLVIQSAPAVLRQIIVQLLDNSFSHAFPDGSGSIAILAEPTEEGILIQFRDDGRGMDSKFAKRLFEPFFTTERGQGRTGLGMLTVHNLIQRIDGNIELKSEPGNGTEYRIRLRPLSR